jgi:hypothetical protein
VGVIVKWLIADNVADMVQGLMVFAGIEGQRGGVKLFLNTTWRGFASRSVLSLADIEVKLNPFVQLLFLRIIREHRAQNVGRLAKLVGLERLKSLFVQGNCLNIGGSDDRSWELDRSWWIRL